MVLGRSAQSHVHQLQQELRRAERAVPALLPLSSPASCSQPQGLDTSAEPGQGGCSPWLGPHPHIPAAKKPQDHTMGVSYKLMVGFLLLSQGDTTGSDPASVLCTPT